MNNKPEPFPNLRLFVKREQGYLKKSDGAEEIVKGTEFRKMEKGSRRESTKGCFNPCKNGSSPRGKNKRRKRYSGILRGRTRKL